MGVSEHRLYSQTAIKNLNEENDDYMICWNDPIYRRTHVISVAISL